MTSKTLSVTGAQEFKKTVLENDLPVLVDFWAPWCVPCQMMAPILDELGEAMTGKLAVAKVNTEQSENHPLALEYRIMSIPNMKLFKNGEVIGEFIGLRNLQTLTEEIERLL